jgi:hypothetical protein
LLLCFPGWALPQCFFFFFRDYLICSDHGGLPAIN